MEFLCWEFDTPIFVMGIDIFETYNPGSCIKIEGVFILFFFLFLIIFYF